MRALCGAIITAGAMVGLGLTAVAFAVRFQGSTLTHGDPPQLYGIPSMMIILVVLILAVIIGTGIAFLGLAFHHERRQHELDRDLSRTPRSETMTTR